MAFLIILAGTCLIAFFLMEAIARQRDKHFDYMVATKVYQNLAATQLYRRR